MANESKNFWSQESQVASFPADVGALPYEIDLVRSAATVSARAGVVADVHVIGVGTGRELSGTRAAIPDTALTAWDISEQMVDACRDYITRTGMDNVVVRCKDLTRLSAEDGPADVAVLLNAVLCYLSTPDERESAFAALRRLVRPGGSICAVVHQPNGRPDWAAWFAARRAMTRMGMAQGAPGDRLITHGGRSMLFHHYRPSEITGLLRLNGFDAVNVRSLRSWARSTGKRIPVKSPNPLLVIAA